MNLDDNKPTDVKSLSSVAADHGDKGTSLRLMVVIGDEVITRALPADGVLAIGRLKDADIPVPNSTVSRKHGNLVLGPSIFIEDCGSTNGISVRGRRLSRGEKVEIGPGEIVELGDAMMVLQRISVPRAPREIRGQREFDRQLKETCHRAERNQQPFGLMLVRVSDEVPGSSVEEAFDLCLQGDDVLGETGTGEYACLIIDRSAERVEELCRRFIETLHGHQAGVRTGIACYPRDALTSGLLLDKARAHMRGDRPSGEASDVIVEDVLMQQLHRLIERVAPSNINVLIQGETGVGKEVVARLLHRHSHRPDHLFVSVNCAALPQALLESELFGHERGAFTGATKAKPGLLEIARNGTFLLDEVSEMPPVVQAKLLRMLEERQAVRVGGLKPYGIDARFVATTNRDLDEAVRHGIFREDLYYRLEGVLLKVPPLRERPDDILPLARMFIRHTCHQLGREPVPRLERDAIAWLLEHAWPGNVRELRNVMERAALLCAADRIDRAGVTASQSALQTQPPAPVVPVAPATNAHGDLHPLGDDYASVPTSDRLVPFAPDSSKRLKDEMKDLEYRRILDALERAGGNQTRAAKLLGISRRTLINRLDDYGIERPRKGKKNK